MIAADVADEAHVEHAIGLVEDEDLDAAQVDRALPGMVEQAPGRRDDDVDAATQRGKLAAEADAAVDRGRASGLLRRRCGRSPRPGSRAPGWERGSRARMRGRWPAGRRLRGGELLQHRQHEGRRLAGAGLGAGEQVATGEHERNRLALDGRGFGVAAARDGAEQVGRQPELGKGQGNMLLTRPSRTVRGPVRAVGESRSGRSDDRGADRSAYRTRFRNGTTPATRSAPGPSATSQASRASASWNTCSVPAENSTKRASSTLVVPCRCSATVVSATSAPSGAGYP